MENVLTHWDIPLAEPTPEALNVIAPLGPIVELGAGDGTWAEALRARGCDVVALDIEPRGDGVLRGDETDAAVFADRTLLMVWPPQHDQAQSWLDAAPWRTVVFVGQPLRLHLDLSAYEGETMLTIPGLRKGPSEVIVYRRRP